ncbi:hypothetical protein [Thermohalobacter berrensis]|uniref:Uncharacterized protein n=1 Tax=Thermohalobacter berrensis TaxID=99594 RepID=A0A419T0G7_9FIRM|nr:hypothetical protein [Thermohalobacter berrensis]RKD30929.1 hypothetical protein BET03_13075 [Thermohalobacter berrensis]
MEHVIDNFDNIDKCLKCGKPIKVVKLKYIKKKIENIPNSHLINFKYCSKCKRENVIENL